MNAEASSLGGIWQIICLPYAFSLPNFRSPKFKKLASGRTLDLDCIVAKRRPNVLKLTESLPQAIADAA